MKANDKDFFREPGDFSDELYPKAKELALKNYDISSKFLQGKLNIERARALVLMDMLEEDSVIKRTLKEK